MRVVMGRRETLFISLCVGLLGSGYVLYKLYNGHRQRLLDLERELEPYPIVTNFFKTVRRGLGANRETKIKPFSYSDVWSAIQPMMPFFANSVGNGVATRAIVQEIPSYYVHLRSNVTRSSCSSNASDEEKQDSRSQKEICNNMTWPGTWIAGELKDKGKFVKFICCLWFDRLQAHFESIQRIVDLTTLPYAMYYLWNRVSDELDHSQLTDRLKLEKDTLTSLEKIEIWENLKILNFTRLAVSLWAMTVLTLYIRVQVNILGRHLYIDTARGMGASYLLVRPFHFCFEVFSIPF
ncbi:hypothetical protein IFM89_006698 [Coptis chinensis]|uniref:Uncharacterized protein n=1 Tax=Coptis chinensis TaxID=261450 RepID=A0A835HCX5_9MAGN|nr:hypothetical protein IFM89_006698 [Coptis chinensis]